MVTTHANRLLLGLFGGLVVAVIVARIVIVYRRTGILPIVQRKEDTAHDFIQRVNLVVFGLDGLSILCYASSHAHYAQLIPIRCLEIRSLQTLVIVVAYLSLAWSAVAQAQLGTAWRIGIDAEDKSELVTNGLYSLSRHPTYFGFMVMAVALFLAMPNAVSLVAASLAIAVLPIEARLEEEFLVARHGDHYRAYRRRTRRWL